MPVSGYVIRCEPADQPAVLAQLESVSGAVIGVPAASGIPIAVETGNNRDATEMGEQLCNLAGVRAAVLVYHNFEDLPDATAPMPPSGKPIEHP